MVPGISGVKGASSVSPAGLAFLGLGTFIQGQSKYDALTAQGESERANASFYRLQADFAQQAGDAKEAVYHQESQILFGEQESGFAKAGFDSSNSSFFMATQMLQRQKGEGAIRLDTNMNVLLAQERAFASDKTANDYDSAAKSAEVGTFIQTAAVAAAFI